MDQPNIEKNTSVFRGMGTCNISVKSSGERGFDLPSFCKIVQNLCLQVNSRVDKDLKVLVDLLFSHGFLLSRNPF